MLKASDNMKPIQTGAAYCGCIVHVRTKVLLHIANDVRTWPFVISPPQRVFIWQTLMGIRYSFPAERPQGSQDALAQFWLETVERGKGK